MIRLAVLVVLLVAGRAASAQVLWEPQNLGDGRAFPIVMVPSELIPILTVGDIRVVFGTTPLAEVARRFGATAGHRGDANDSLDWICLTGRDAGGRWILWLESGEIHSDAVGAFQLRRTTENDSVDARCRNISASLQNPAGLRLDMRRDDVRRILGGTGATGQTLTFVHEHQDASNLTVESIVTVTLRQEVVIAFEVWKTETN